MKTLQLNIEDAVFFAKQGAMKAMENEAVTAMSNLEDGKGAGNDFLGWVHLPSSITAGQLDDIEKTAAALRKDNEYIVCVGIGGSYLGARAVTAALNNSFEDLRPAARVTRRFSSQDRT